MTVIKKIIHPYAYELRQARLDEAHITGQPLMDRPFYYENIETGEQYYDILACIGWPTEVSDKDEGRPGYLGIVGVIKTISRLKNRYSDYWRRRRVGTFRRY